MISFLCDITIVSVATWMTALPNHASGTIVNYGDSQLMQDQAIYRDYDLNGYVSGIAVMSPSDLGRPFWIRVNNVWYGPFLAVDTSTRHDFCDNVGYRREVAEVPSNIMRIMTGQCCIEKAEILRYGERQSKPTPYYQHVQWGYVPEGQYEPSPKPFISPTQEVIFP